MTGEFTVDGLRIGVDPASMRIVESDALPPDTAVFVTDDGRVKDFFRPGKIEITAKLDPEKFAEMFRLMAGSVGKVAQALRSLRVGLWHLPALRRPRSPGPADAATRRLHTAQRHVYRRALRRRRRSKVTPRRSTYYMPNAVIHEWPDRSLEAQFMAYRPKG